MPLCLDFYIGSRGQTQVLMFTLQEFYWQSHLFNPRICFSVFISLHTPAIKAACTLLLCLCGQVHVPTVEAGERSCCKIAFVCLTSPPEALFSYPLTHISFPSYPTLLSVKDLIMMWALRRKWITIPKNLGFFLKRFAFWHRLEIFFFLSALLVSEVRLRVLTNTQPISKFSGSEVAASCLHFSMSSENGEETVGERLV